LPDITAANGPSQCYLQRLGAGTQAIHLAAAMGLKSRLRDRAYSSAGARLVGAGCDVIALGKMVIGNTCAATAVMSAMLNIIIA
jgi:NaMN:DMB phosphoribosyltransferase